MMTITKMNDAIGHFTHKQEISLDGHIYVSYITNKEINMRTVRRLYPKIYKRFIEKFIVGEKLPLKIPTLREHFPKAFHYLMITLMLGDAILDTRIERNRNNKKKKAQMMRDINYRDIFGIKRALEIHPCYFDSFQ